MNKESINELNILYNNIILKHFDFSKYPSYFNININAGEYAWKPVIINEVMNTISDYTNTILLWCDSGNIFTTDLYTHYNIIKQNNVYSPTSSGTIRQWTHPKTLEWFNINYDDIVLTYSPRNGAILGFNIENIVVREFIKKFNDLACIKDCIAPQGSNRSNHRQDQAVFTLLYYNFFKQYPTNNIIDSYYNIRIHCDID